MSIMTWEERWHPLREECGIVALRRRNHPWSGKVIKREEAAVPTYVADCYLRPAAIIEASISTSNFIRRCAVPTCSSIWPALKLAAATP
jgi:hypothetical protein